MSVVVDAEESREADHQVQHDQDTDLRCDRSRLGVEDGMVITGRHQDHAEHPEDRAGRADAPAAGTKRKAGRAGGDAAHRVQQEHDPRAIHALDDLAREPEGIHVEAEMDQKVGHARWVVDQRHSEKPVVLAVGHQQRVQPQLAFERVRVDVPETTQRSAQGRP